MIQPQRFFLHDRPTIRARRGRREVTAREIPIAARDDPSATCREVRPPSQRSGAIALVVKSQHPAKHPAGSCTPSPWNGPVRVGACFLLWCENMGTVTRRSLRWAVSACLWLMASTPLMPVGWAQEQTARSTEVTYRPTVRNTIAAPPPAPSQAQLPVVAVLSPEQLDYFSNLVDDAKSNAQSRLLARPDLLPLAIESANARMKRERAGKTLTVAGFIIVGGSVNLGYLIIMMTDLNNMTFGGCDASCAQNRDSGTRIGIAVGAVGAALGLLLAASGVYTLNRRTGAELRAAEEYARESRIPAAPASRSSLGTSSNPQGVGLPLVDVKF